MTIAKNQENTFPFLRPDFSLTIFFSILLHLNEIQAVEIQSLNTPSIFIIHVPSCKHSFIIN